MKLRGANDHGGAVDDDEEGSKMSDDEVPRLMKRPSAKPIVVLKRPAGLGVKKQVASLKTKPAGLDVKKKPTSDKKLGSFTYRTAQECNTPRYYGEQTVYTDTGRCVWRIKPGPSRRDDTKIGYLHDPREKWDMVVKILKKNL
jgi:hypothetical protein